MQTAFQIRSSFNMCTRRIVIMQKEELQVALRFVIVGGWLLSLKVTITQLLAFLQLQITTLEPEKFSSKI